MSLIKIISPVRNWAHTCATFEIIRERIYQPSNPFGKEKRISYRLSNITLNDIYFRLERQSSVQLSSLQDATSE